MKKIMAIKLEGSKNQAWQPGRDLKRALPQYLVEAVILQV